MQCCSTKDSSHGCCGSGKHHFGPHFWSKKKKIEMLEKHVDMLKDEIVNIEEMITDLKAEK